MTVLPDMFEERNEIVCFAEFLKLGVALILRYLVTDLIGSSATRALLLPDKETSLHPLQPYQLWWPINGDNCSDGYF